MKTHDQSQAGYVVPLKAFQLIGGGKKENRKENDFYPTPPDVTHALMKFLHKECSFIFDTSLKIWEPSCGDGAMSEVIKQYGHTVTSTELRSDSGYGETGIDFLTSNPMTADAIITNPPFNLSEQFINKALGNSRIVCMLLKSQYWHAKKRYHLFNISKPKFVLPLTWRPDFDGRGAPTMDLAWTVWIKGYGTSCIYQPISKPSPPPCQ